MGLPKPAGLRRFPRTPEEGTGTSANQKVRKILATIGSSVFPGLSRADDRIALAEGGAAHTYRDLSTGIVQCAGGLLGAGAAGGAAGTGGAAGARGAVKDLAEERIGVALPAGLDYVIALHGIWRSGGIAVPLNPASAEPELEHCLTNAGVHRVIANREHPGPLAAVSRRIGIDLRSVEDLRAAGVLRMGEVLRAGGNAQLPHIDGARRAMILFTSGTTGKPKGAVFAHDALHGQIRTLIEAWRWSPNDSIPLFLPLHHFHGIVNVLNCALWCGASVQAMPKLDVKSLCAQVARGSYTVFMAVPTIYRKLIEHIVELGTSNRKAVCTGFRRMRLNVSGSSACPTGLFERWKELTGHKLLERYGTTEIGMAISNPYEGKRRAGSIGNALPGVTAQLFGDNDKPVRSEGVPGEIRVRGENIFQGYWNDTQATRDSFRQGWFRTGDIAVIDNGRYRILGRSSIDIIKSGGYKISALEIESVLLDHDDIREAAVIGVPDATWGEQVAAAVTLRDGASLEYAELKQWCASRMSAYKIPRRLRILEALPRNAMGKVIKTVLREPET